MFTLKTERRSGFFVANMIFPSILINYLSLASFMIPSWSEESIGFSVTIFLAQTVNMITTSQYIPNGGSEIPIWGRYLVASLIHLTLVVLINVKISALRNGNGEVKDLKVDSENFGRSDVRSDSGHEEVENPAEGYKVKPQPGDNIEFVRKLLFFLDLICLTVLTAAVLIFLRS